MRGFGHVRHPGKGVGGERNPIRLVPGVAAVQGEFFTPAGDRGHGRAESLEGRLRAGNLRDLVHADQLGYMGNTLGPKQRETNASASAIAVSPLSR
jgi:hypothetical protein